MTRCVALVVVFVAVAALRADDQTKKPTSQDVLAKLAGIWQAEKAEFKGEVAPGEALKKIAFTINGDQIVPGDNPKDPATLSLDPSKSPAEINLTEKNGKTSLGIYKFDGDKLELCFTEPGNPRPTEFKATKENKAMYFVLKRKKD